MVCSLCKLTGHNRKTCNLNPKYRLKQCSNIINDIIKNIEKMDGKSKSKKAENGKREKEQLIDIENHCNTNTSSGSKIKESLKNKYSIEIKNIQIVAGRGHHYDLIINTDEDGLLKQYKIEYKGNYKLIEFKEGLTPWFNGVQFYNGDPKPFSIIKKYSRQWYDMYIKDKAIPGYSIPTYEDFVKDAFKQGKNTLPYMVQFKSDYRAFKGIPKTSMLEERIEFNRKFIISPAELETLKTEISPIFTKIMKDKELWLQISGDLSDPEKFNVKWTKGMVLTHIPELRVVTIKTQEPDIKFNCECEKTCGCEDKKKCECIPFTFEAHLRWGYGQGFSNLRLDFK